MTLTLRLDVDKPYGCRNLSRRIISKLREDYTFPIIEPLGYLEDVSQFLDLLNAESVPAIFYHRLCTVPNAEVIKKLNSGRHRLGLHAENTRSLETFDDELRQFRSAVGNIAIHSFSKHGSGKLKLGRNHYPPYEPEKYLVWSQKVGVPFMFGNEPVESISQFSNEKTFFPAVFWIEDAYRNSNASSIDWLLSVAEKNTAIVLTHPENFFSRPQVEDDFLELLRKAKERGIEWTTDPRSLGKPMPQ